MADEQQVSAPGEREWVEALVERVRDDLHAKAGNEAAIRVESGKRLTYAHEVFSYGPDDKGAPRSAGYETDLLVSDVDPEGRWIPRVVVECKTWAITTHDALTYSAKAATHKQVHPYLRYGILIGNYGTALPARLVRHGACFDFMMVWNSSQGSQEEWADFIDVLVDEVRSSRQLQQVLTDRTRGRETFRLLHRPLRLKSGQAHGPPQT
jgi:hypothetical protein